MSGGEEPTQGCNLTGSTPAFEYTYGDGSNLTYVGLTSEETPSNEISLSSFSEWNGPTEPGVYSLARINYADCGLCLLANTNCTEDGCDKVLYAEEGEVEITEIGLS